MYDLEDGRRHTDLLSRSGFGASPGDVVLGERPSRTKIGKVIYCNLSTLFTPCHSRGNQAFSQNEAVNLKSSKV